MAHTNNVHVLDRFNFRCRNDGVLIRVVDKGKTDNGIYLPDTSIQGKEFIVVDFGPKVENLKVGDRVMMVGIKGESYSELPFARDLIFLREGAVVLVMEEKPEEDWRK